MEATETGQPTVYERWNYNGEFNLLIAERDRVLLVLNRCKTITKAARVLKTTGKHLYNLRIYHRISKEDRVWVSANKWED